MQHEKSPAEELQKSVYEQRDLHMNSLQTFQVVVLLVGSRERVQVSFTILLSFHPNF